MRIWIGVVICAFLGGLHVGMWLEREHGAGRSAERQSGLQCFMPEPREGSAAPPVVRLRPASLPVQIPVTVTGYSSTPDQTDGSPFTAAWGDDVRTLRAKGYVTLAVSRDLEALLPPGTVLMVADRMHERWRRRVDLWFPSRHEATRWGVRRAVLEIAR